MKDSKKKQIFNNVDVLDQHGNILHEGPSYKVKITESEFRGSRQKRSRSKNKKQETFFYSFEMGSNEDSQFQFKNEFSFFKFALFLFSLAFNTVWFQIQKIYLQIKEQFSTHSSPLEALIGVLGIALNGLFSIIVFLLFAWIFWFLIKFVLMVFVFLFLWSLLDYFFKKTIQLLRK